MQVSSFGSFAAPPKNESQTTGSADFFVPTVALMTYDVSTISRDNVIDLLYNTYGKIAGFHLSKSTGNLGVLKK